MLKQHRLGWKLIGFASQMDGPPETLCKIGVDKPNISTTMYWIVTPCIFKLSAILIIHKMMGYGCFGQHGLVLRFIYTSDEESLILAVRCILTVGKLTKQSNV